MPTKYCVNLPERSKRFHNKILFKKILIHTWYIKGPHAFVLY